MSVNRVILLGNVTADPEVRNLPSGGKVVTLTVATNERWRDRNSGEQKERSEFHRVVIFNEALAKVAEQYLKKGSKVYLEGQLQTRSWEDQSGQKKFSTEVVLQSFNSALQLLDSREGSSEPRQQERAPVKSGGYRAASADPFDGDNIPFAPEFR